MDVDVGEFGSGLVYLLIVQRLSLLVSFFFSQVTHAWVILFLVSHQWL